MVVAVVKPLQWIWQFYLLLQALGRRRDRHLGAYYIEGLDELLCVSIGGLTRNGGLCDWSLE